MGQLQKMEQTMINEGIFITSETNSSSRNILNKYKFHVTAR